MLNFICHVLKKNSGKYESTRSAPDRAGGYLDFGCAAVDAIA
jgi:hypothetical protein